MHPTQWMTDPQPPTHPDGYIESKTIHVYGNTISQHFPAHDLRGAVRAAKSESAKHPGTNTLITWHRGKKK